MLFGRDVECARIDAVLDAARERRSQAVVLRGEAGIGKSALLQYAVQHAEDFLVLNALGVESDAELAFAGAQQLAGPIVHELVELPQLQSASLARAFAIEEGPPPDRLTVSVSMLGLLAAVAERQPVLCVVDDAHWLDQASAQMLTFVARRLYAERVAILFAAREPELAVFPAAGVPDLRVGSLAPDAARELLLAHAPDLAETTAERLLELTEGNPLALLEISHALTRQQRLGRAPLDQPLPVGAEIERVFLERVAALSGEAQRALVLVAAGDPGDADTLWRALAASDLDREPVAEARAAGLLHPTRLLFCHPLARSAVYRTVRPSDRRAAHTKLATASDEPDRRAWHLASATDRPDAAVAAALEAAAAAARNRGGVAAEAKALERSAQLTADPEGRAHRLLKAAGAAEAAGWLEHAETLLAEAAELTEDGDLRAQAIARRSYLLFDRGEFDARTSLR